MNEFIIAFKFPATQRNLYSVNLNTLRGPDFMRFGENQFVSWLPSGLPRSSNAEISIGDDAALLNCGNKKQLISTDMLLDGTHFIAAATHPELIGRKAAAVNLSDIAAMGGRPETLFVSLAIPAGTSPDWVKRVMSGAAAIAREFNCGIDGGDTNTWNGPFAINVTIIGTPHWRGAVTRSGAKSGDVVMVSGQTLGHTLNTGRHLTFTPRVLEATWLMDHFKIHSMMDISDGLAADLPRLAAASAKQITIYADQIVADPGHDASLRSALCDGEDFELLFTCAPEDAAIIEAICPWPCGFRKIGIVADGSGVRVSKNNSTATVPLSFEGYEH